MLLQWLYLWRTGHCAVHRQCRCRYCVIISGTVAIAPSINGNSCPLLTCCASRVFPHYVTVSLADRQTICNAIFLFQMLICQFYSRLLCPIWVHNHLTVINVNLSVNILNRVSSSCTGSSILAWCHLQVTSVKLQVDTVTSAGEVIQLLLQPATKVQK